MAAADSTLRIYPVAGQLDPAWLASAIPWTHVRATAILSRPADGAPVVDPTNNAHEHPLTVVNTLTAAAADGQWATAPLKPTTSTGADLALAPSGLTWEITLEIKRGATWHEVITYEVAPSGDRDYDGEGELITVDGDDCIDINALIPPPAAIPPGELFSDAVLEVLTANPSAIAADLSVTRDATTVTVASSTGTDATLPAATASLAGQLTAADKAKLDAITGTNTGDQTATTVAVTPTGNLAATTVQAGLAEHQGDIDTLTTAVAPVAAAVATTAGAGDAAKLVKLNASGLVDRSMTAAARPYAYLKTSGGTVNSAITADITAGRLATGDIITTGTYYQGGSIGGCTYQVVAAATGTDDGGSYINAGSLQLKAAFGPYIDVACFGAVTGTVVASGVNTPRIQAAIDFAAVGAFGGLTSSPGALVWFGPGAWKITTLEIKSGVTLAGAGPRATWLLANGTGNSIESDSFQSLTGTAIGTTAGEHSFGIRDLALIGQPTANHGIALVGSTYELRNLVIRDYGGYGLWSEWAVGGGSGPSGAGLETVISDCRFIDNRTGNVMWLGPHDSMIHRCFFIERPQIVGAGAVATNVEVAANANATGAGAFFTNCHWWGTGADVHLLAAANLTHVHGSQIESANSTNLVIDAAECQFTGVAVYDANKTTGAGATTGIQVGVADGADVIGCRIQATVEYCHAAPIDFVNDGAFNHIDINTLLTNTEDTPTHTGTHDPQTYVRILHGIDSAHSSPKTYLWDPADRSGATAQRPVLNAGDEGRRYFDTDLGQPIWWDGTDWVDATGSTV